MPDASPDGRRPGVFAPWDVLVRQALLEPAREWFGLEMVHATGMPSGTVYPIITRLEQAGWIVSRWEEPAERRDQARPRRRYYQLTEDGAENARLALARPTRTGRPHPCRGAACAPTPPGAPS